MPTTRERKSRRRIPVSVEMQRRLYSPDCVDLKLTEITKKIGDMWAQEDEEVKQVVALGLSHDVALSGALREGEEGVREEDGGIQEDAPHGKEEHRPRYAQETAERLLLVRQRAS